MCIQIYARVSGFQMTGSAAKSLWLCSWPWTWSLRNHPTRKAAHCPPPGVQCLLACGPGPQTWMACYHTAPGLSPTWTQAWLAWVRLRPVSLRVCNDTVSLWSSLNRDWQLEGWPGVLEHRPWPGPGGPPCPASPWPGQGPDCWPGSGLCLMASDYFNSP